MVNNIIGKIFPGKPKASTIMKGVKGDTDSKSPKSSTAIGVIGDFVRITENFVVRITEDGSIRTIE